MMPKYHKMSATKTIKLSALTMTIALSGFLAFAAAPLSALEGGSTSSANEWQDVKPPVATDEATRQQELADRQQAIQDDITKLKDRLKTQPSPDLMEQLHNELQQVRDNYGWEPKSGLLFGHRSISPMLKKQNTMPKNLLAAFVQLNKDLQARDIDLIIAPMVPNPHFAAHLLVDGIGPDNDYYPGWTEMVIEMLENDLEVIDTTTAYRHAAEDKVLVSWVNDFHTASRGREITAKAVAQRLQRYAFARAIADKASQAKVVEVTEPVTKTGRIFVLNKGTLTLDQWLAKNNPGKKRQEIMKMARELKTFPADSGLTLVPGGRTPRAIVPDVPKDLLKQLLSREFSYQKLTLPANLERHNDLVFIGDSQLHSAVHGSGYPAFLMNEIGGLFRWGSKSWSGFSPPEIFLEVVPKTAVQPRVVVLSFLPKYFWHAYDRKSGKINEAANKYKARPLPPVKGGSKTNDLPQGPITATIRIDHVSQKPTEDPSTLDYDEALIHLAATVQDGPLKGQTIGLRYWILQNGEWTKANAALKVGIKRKVKLTPWMDAIKKDGSLAQHQVFDTTDLDLTVPVYWAGDWKK